MKKAGWVFALGFLVILCAWKASQRRFDHVFRNFPVNQARTVTIDWGESTLQRSSERERADQIRDWLVLALLSDAGLGRDELSAAAFDLPPARFGYLEPLSSFEYGRTRSRAIGHGEILALLPAGETKALRSDDLGLIADEFRANTGHVPGKIHVFEYKIGDNGLSAILTRRDTIPGSSFFSESAGFHQAKITDTNSLAAFLRQVEDISIAQLLPDGLLLGGRKLRAGYRGVTLEDIAALWQSQARGDALAERTEAFNRKWRSGVTYRTGTEKKLLDQQYETERSQLMAEIKSSRASRGSGFSLDPAFDYDELEKKVGGLRPSLSRIVSGQDLATALSSLREHNAGPFLELLVSLRSEQPQSELVRRLIDLERRERFQAARYDGYLQGTKVGMTLFYTDLLAKLKAIDYWNDHSIQDFKSLTEVQVAPIYRQEVAELNSTRLWFGPRDRGYQLKDQEILFAHNATRIYAASSDLLKSGVEAAPNAASGAFLFWWDSHFDEVAAREPEYQRLNQIMKWSLVISWLADHGRSQALGGLQNVPVQHDLWFPRWASTNNGLQYRDWQRFDFYDRGYKGLDTEAMPILYSEPFQRYGDSRVISGGVSLSNKELIHDRPALPPARQADELRTRAGLDFRNRAENSPRELRTLAGVRYIFEDNGGEGITRSEIGRSAIKARSPLAELRPQPLKQAYRQTSGKLEIDVSVGDASLGQFYSDVSTHTPVRIGFRARAIDLGQGLAERASTAAAHGTSLENFLGNSEQVEYFVKFGGGLGCDGCMAVKLRGSTGYLKIQQEAAPSASIPFGWEARAASFEPGAKNFNLAWISSRQLHAEIGAADYIRMKSPTSSSTGIDPPTFTRGPPPRSSPGEFDFGGRRIAIFKDDDGNLYLPRSNLPPEWQDPAIFSRFANSRFEQRANAFSKVDEDFSKGNFDQAQRELDLRAGQDDTSDDWVARQALVFTAEGKPDQAVRSIQDAIGSSPRVIDSTLSLINDRLEKPSNVTERDNLVQLAAMLDIGYGQPFVNNGQLHFTAHLANEVANSHVVRASDIRENGPLYVLDSTHSIPQAAIFASMPDQVARDLGTIVQLPRSDLAHAQPLIIETADGTRYRLAGEAGAWQSAAHGGAAGGASGSPRAGPKHYIRFQMLSALCSTDQTSTQHDSPDDCNRPIYLYRPKLALPPQMPLNR
jgi:hypothetical protein